MFSQVKPNSVNKKTIRISAIKDSKNSGMMSLYNAVGKFSSEVNTL